MNGRIDNFIVRQPDGTTRCANSLVLGAGLTVTETAGGIPELQGALTPVFVGAKLSLSGNVSVPPLTQVLLSFDVATLDSQGFWSATAPTRLTVPAGMAGVYQVVTQGVFSGGNPGSRAAGAVRNGTERVALAFSEEAGGPISVTTAQIVRLEEGDYLEMGVRHEAGSTIDVVGGAPEQTAFILFRIGV